VINEELFDDNPEATPLDKGIARILDTMRQALYEAENGNKQAQRDVQRMDALAAGIYQQYIEERETIGAFSIFIAHLISRQVKNFETGGQRVM
jgi:hypothetical protein